MRRSEVVGTGRRMTDRCRHRCWRHERPTSLPISPTDVGDVGTTNIGRLSPGAALNSRTLFPAEEAKQGKHEFEFKYTRAGEKAPMLVRPTPPTSLPRSRRPMGVVRVAQADSLTSTGHASMLHTLEARRD